MDSTIGEPKIHMLMDEDLNKAAELYKMKFIATALLVFSFLVFIVASLFTEKYMWAGFVQATAEAAMVGAVADWFAVTALFRHPLNLKIPHTAIIPAGKDAIGENLGRFVKTNFLSKFVISDKLRSIDIAQALARWLIQPANSALIADHVAAGLATIIQAINNEDVQHLIERNVTTRVRAAKIAPLLGNLLSLVTANGQERELLQGTVKLGSRQLEENKEAILIKIHEETPWWLPRNVDLAIYDKLADMLEETFQAVSEDPEHPLYDHFKDLLNRFVEDLKHSPEVAAKEEALKEALLQDTLIQEFSRSLWLDIKALFVERGTDPDLDVRQSIRQGLISFGEAILNDLSLRNKLNGWIEDGTIYLTQQYGHEVEQLISQTIRRWDAEATSRKIELQVGKDLQFIRINGTLVGGLVGLVIHALSLLL